MPKKFFMSSSKSLLPPISARARAGRGMWDSAGGRVPKNIRGLLGYWVIGLLVLFALINLGVKVLDETGIQPGDFFCLPVDSLKVFL